MSDRQFNTYARFYDLLYKDKDYKKESAYIHELIQAHSKKQSADLRLLDLACGTGKHLLELYDLGYSQLSGSDISASMIKVARDNAATQKKNLTLHNFSFQKSAEINEQFDVVISMFSAINYLTNYNDQLKAFRNIHGLLRDDGLFIFDFWNGNAVIRDYSPMKFLRKQNGQEEIIRVSSTNIDPIKQDVTVKFNCLFLDGKKIIDEFEEIHLLHYYHFSEILNLLKFANFEVLHLSPFMEPKKEIGSHDWNVSIVARKSTYDL